MRFRTTPHLLVLTLGLFGCDDRYLVGFGPDGGGGSGSGTGGSGVGPNGTGGVGGGPIPNTGGVGGSVGPNGTGGVGGGPIPMNTGGVGGGPIPNTGGVGGSGGTVGGAGGSEIGGSGGTVGGAGGRGGVGGSGGTVGGAGGAGGTGGSGGVAACPPATPQATFPLAISGTQAADRLARLLWSQRADDALLARAQGLRTSGDVQVLAREMLRDGRARRNVGAIMSRWLRLEELGNRRMPGQNEVLFQAFRRESAEFVTRLIWTEDGSLQTLLTAPFTFADVQELSDFYGGGVVVPADGFPRITMDPRQQRSGILTQGLLLNAHPRASGRGNWIRGVFLCQDVPPPPESSSTLLPTDPPTTYRQRLERSVAAQPACVGCHTLTDPPGFALEHYDPQGTWRDNDSFLPIDTSGLLDHTSSPTVAFDGPRSLAVGLMRSCVVAECVSRNFLEQALGGELRSAEERASLAELAGTFAASGFNLRDLLIAVTGSKAFLAP